LQSRGGIKTLNGSSYLWFDQQDREILKRIALAGYDSDKFLARMLLMMLYMDVVAIWREAKVAVSDENGNYYYRKSCKSIIIQDTTVAEQQVDMQLKVVLILIFFWRCCE
jgi:hypothetical protein